MAFSEESGLSGPYTGNDATTVFSFDFKAQVAADVAVYLDGVLLAAADYSVSLSEVGGSVTLDTAPAAGVEVFVALDPSFDQETALTQGEGWLAEPINKALDRAAQRDIYLRELLSRTALTPVGASAISFGTLTDGGFLVLSGDEIITDPATPESNAAMSALAVSSATSAALSAATALTASGSASADRIAAEAARDEALDAAAAAALAADRIYPDTATALTALAEGDYFYVQVGDDLQLYREVGGAAEVQDFVLAGAVTIAAAAVAHRRYSSPYVEEMADEYSREIVEDIHIDGGDSKEDGRYILNRESLNLGGGNGRVQLRLYDRVLGIDVCEWGLLDTQANLLARTSPYVFLTQGALPGFTGITATAEVNWPGLNFTTAFSAYTTAAEGGIRGDRVTTRAEIMKRFAEKAEPKIKLTYGAGAVTATHFNSFEAANTSLQIPGTTITRSTYPSSDICSFSNQVVIECVDDAYSEEIASRVSSPGINMGALLAPFTTLRGAGDGTTMLYMDSGDDAPVLEGPFPFRIEKMHLKTLAGSSGYTMHNDNQNGNAKRATVGPAILRYPMVQVFEDCTLETSIDMLTWNIGCGLSNGHLLILRRCRIITGAPAKIGLGAHTSGSTTDGGTIIVEDSYFNDELITPQNAIALLKSHAMTVQHDIVVRNSALAGISVSNSAGGDPGYRLVGKLDSDITVTGTLDR